MKGSDGKDPCEATDSCHASLHQEPGGYGTQHHTCVHEAPSICSGRLQQKSMLWGKTWENGRKMICQPSSFPPLVPMISSLHGKWTLPECSTALGPFSSSHGHQIAALHGVHHTHLEGDVRFTSDGLGVWGTGARQAQSGQPSPADHQRLCL